MRMGIGLGVGINRSNYAQGIFGAYATRVVADGGVTEAGACVDAVSGLLQTASLLLIPSGYKSGKAYAEIPTNGNGDLTWTRASTALRTNSSGLLESMGSGVPRLSYMYGSCPSALLEPQRTNSIRNSTMVGASTSPSTLPNNYGVFGITGTVVGIGTENGLSYVDIRFSGTASGANTQVQLETTTAITASNGQTWTQSVYLKLINTSTPPIDYNMRLREGTAAGVFVADGITAISPTTSLQRFTYTRTNTGALTERIQPILLFNQVAGNTYDYTIRIAQPQMELGAYVTTPIFTTSATATRVADSAVKTGISSLIGQSEGTVYLQANLQKYSETGFVVAIGDGTLANSIYLQRTATNGLDLYCRKSGNTDVVLSVLSANWTAGNNKIAIAYGSTSFEIYINGVSQGSASFVGLPSMSQYTVGSRPDNLGTLVATGHYQQMALFTTRLSASNLTTLTTL